MHHSDKHPVAARTSKCERCDQTYRPDTSAWGLCLECLDRELSQMTAKELGDVPGAVLNLFNLKPEYFHE